MPRLKEELREALASLEYAKKRVTFLLGSDEDIKHERRAGLAPHHLVVLAEVLRDAGLEPEILVLEGAGDRAGFSDQEYTDAGARVVTKADLPGISGLDVFHALKEPTEYESEIPGPFLRLGALHLASYPPGVCKMLGKKNIAAIIDGGTVGNCSYRLVGGDRTPIVGSMSRFAGSVSGLKIVEGLEKNRVDAGKIVIVGGGIAGMAAVEKVGPKLDKLVIVEPWMPTRERLPALLAKLGITRYEIQPELTGATLQDAVGVVFAHRSGAKAAEKVCTIDQIRTMKPGAAIADIAIDQGGSILHEGYSEDDEVSVSRKKYQVLFGDDFFYYAETNMPREVPREASEMHGDAVWGYVATLLALTALHGGARQATAALLGVEVRSFSSQDDVEGRSLFDCMTQDLRNGLQLVVEGDDVRITDPEVRKNETLAHWVHTCSKG